MTAEGEEGGARKKVSPSVDRVGSHGEVPAKFDRGGYPPEEKGKDDMAGPGRPPEPTALKALRGNPGKRPLNADEPQAKALASLCPPEGMDDETLKAWDEYVPALLEVPGLLAEVDMLALRLLCEAVATRRTCQKLLAEKGYTMTTPSGYVQQRPEVSIAAQAGKAIKALLTEFGMTPAARARMRVELPSESADPYEAFRNG